MMIDVTHETEIDAAFIERVSREVTQSCALPFALPADRIPEFIIQAAEWFWEEDDSSAEERCYLIRNSEFHRPGGACMMNKTVQLPPQIIGVHAVHKTNRAMRSSAMGDFSLERMMLSGYSTFAGAGVLGAGGAPPSPAGYNITDAVVALYEIDTYEQTMCPMLTYNFNRRSGKLVVLGDLGNSDVVIACMQRVPLQALYGNYYFFRTVCAFARKALMNIYGSYEFKLPGGVTINYSNFSEQADAALDEVKEWMDRNRVHDYFFQPNVM